MPSILTSSIQLTFPLLTCTYENNIDSVDVLNQDQQSYINTLLQDEFVNVMKERMLGPKQPQNQREDDIYSLLARKMVEKEINNSSIISNPDDTTMSIDEKTKINNDYIPNDEELATIINSYNNDLQSTVDLRNNIIQQSTTSITTAKMNDSINDPPIDMTKKFLYNYYPITLLNPRNQQYILFTPDTLSNNNPTIKDSLKQEILRTKQFLSSYITPQPSHNNTNTTASSKQKQTLYEKNIKQANLEFGGYMSRLNALSAQIDVNYGEFQQKLRNYHTFYQLLQNESKAIQFRANLLLKLNQKIKKQHEMFQNHHVNQAKSFKKIK
jgi:hypothetical protein